MKYSRIEELMLNLDNQIEQLKLLDQDINIEHNSLFTLFMISSNGNFITPNKTYLPYYPPDSFSLVNFIAFNTNFIIFAFTESLLNSTERSKASPFYP